MDLRKATELSVQYLQSFFPTAERIQLEEVDITDDDRYWNITLSYEAEEMGQGYLVLGKVRKYKIFKVDTYTGEIRSMKIRDM